MKNKTRLITSAVAVILFPGAFGMQIIAQQTTVSKPVKAGKLHIGSSVKVGKTLLEPGMYRVQHVTEGQENLIIFRIIRMGFKENMGNETLGEEVARVKCRTMPVGKTWKHTKLHVVRNGAGESGVTEVQIAGEAVSYRFDNQK